MSFAFKFMLFLIGLFVIVAAAIWIMGGESKKNSTRISINASPAVVFRYLVQSDEITRWGAGVKTVGSFSDESETQDRIVEIGSGQEAWQDSLLRFQQDQMLSIQSKKFGLIRTLVFQLDENDLGGTNVDYRITESVSGVERFLFPFKATVKRETMVDEMSRLRDLVESENEPPAEQDDPVEESGSPLAPNSDQGNNGTDRPVAGSGTAAGGSSSQGSSVDDESKRGYESLFATGG